MDAGDSARQVVKVEHECINQRYPVRKSEE
jgi:hypothetical protein